jgi:hypothetical protein
MHPRQKRSFDEHYDNLSKDQLLTIYAHQTFGYTLWFVRTIDDDNKVAVLRQGENLVSINSNGTVQKELNVVLRDMDSLNPNSIKDK